MTISDEAITRLEQSRRQMNLAMNAPNDSTSAASIARAAGNLIVQPTVQKHPLTAVVAAVAIGALIYKTRPWRLMANPIVLSALAPIAISKIGLLAPSSEPLLLKGFDLYRQFLHTGSKQKARQGKR